MSKEKPTEYKTIIVKILACPLIRDADKTLAAAELENYSNGDLPTVEFAHKQTDLKKLLKWNASRQGWAFWAGIYSALYRQENNVCRPAENGGAILTPKPAGRSKRRLTSS